MSASPRRLLALALGLAGCTGTPTPEPPDFLPAPDPGLISGEAVGTTESGPTPPVRVAGEAGAVLPTASVWLVNLDDAGAPAVTVRADDQGAFIAELPGEPDDRVRLVVRTRARHSTPLDYRVVASGKLLDLEPLPDTSLSCITLEPSDELTLQGEQTLVITNGCADDAALEGVALRFGDQGFSLGDAAARIPSGASLALPIDYASGDSDEQADVLLFDVVVGEQRGRYAFGLWGRP